MPTSGKVFLLRHEKRNKSISFSSSLTEEGLLNAQKIIVPRLKNLNIKVIYCSPFRRTLQTILPFCQATGMKVNLEWSLAESMPLEPTIFNEFRHIINENYRSFTPYQTPNAKNIISFDQIKQRSQTFIDSLDMSHNILLVTHLPVINAILSNQNPICIDMFAHRNPGCILTMSGTTL
jgi:2,3-bisphosphoglycerate-dependent phosphoglycerate mutase